MCQCSMMIRCRRKAGAKALLACSRNMKFPRRAHIGSAHEAAFARSKPGDKTGIRCKLLSWVVMRRVLLRQDKLPGRTYGPSHYQTGAIVAEKHAPGQPRTTCRRRTTYIKLQPRGARGNSRNGKRPGSATEITEFSERFFNTSICSVSSVAKNNLLLFVVRSITIPSLNHDFGRWTQEIGLSTVDSTQAIPDVKSNLLTMAGFCGTI